MIARGSSGRPVANDASIVENPRHSDFLAIRSALLHSHLADLKEITHDFLYENYRTEKLSKSVEGGSAAYVFRDLCESGASADLNSGSSMNPEDLASQSVRLKEEQLRREEEKLREIEIKVQREINEKRQELLARESQLKEMCVILQTLDHEMSPANSTFSEARMTREQNALAPEPNGDA